MSGKKNRGKRTKKTKTIEIKQYHCDITDGIFFVARQTGVSIEMTCGAHSLVALNALDVLFADAVSVFGLAPRLVVQTTGHGTPARFASGRPEIEVVLGAPIAFVAGHACTTLTLAFGVALQRPRPCKRESSSVSEKNFLKKNTR